LNQVTLNEVIENLAALRDGKGLIGRDSVEPSAAPPKTSAKPSAPAKAAAPRVAEKTPPPEAKAETQDRSAIDHEAVWRKAVGEVRSRRRLISGWVEAGTALGIDGRFFLVGFPPEQRTAMESLSIPRTREFLEALIKELSGQDWKIKFVLKEGLPVVAPMEAPSAPAPKKPETQATFKDDPLIREALEIFKGEIKTVSD
jgi:hypothetical protein